VGWYFLLEWRSRRRTRRPPPAEPLAAGETLR